MVVSKGREYDRAIRLDILRIMQSAIRMGKTDWAKELGEFSRKLSERIKNHDYKKEDAEYQLVSEIDARKV
jgi:hypothetical protein